MTPATSKHTDIWFYRLTPIWQVDYSKILQLGFDIEGKGIPFFDHVPTPLVNRQHVQIFKTYSRMITISNLLSNSQSLGEI